MLTHLVDVSAGRRLVARHSDRHAGAVCQLHNGLDEALAKGALPHNARSPIILQRPSQHLEAAAMSALWGGARAWHLNGPSTMSLGWGPQDTSSPHSTSRYTALLA